MVIELREKSQITIPSSIIKSLKLHVGDQFDVLEKDGMICLVPVVTYPKKYVNELKEEVNKLEKDIKNGSAQGYENLVDLIEALNK